MAETLIDYIKKLCKRQGLSWRAASIRAGLNPSYIANWVTGVYAGTPRARTLKNIAEALEGDYAYMLSLVNLAPEQPTPHELLACRLADAFEQLSPDCQETVMAVIETLAELERQHENSR